MQNFTIDSHQIFGEPYAPLAYIESFGIKLPDDFVEAHLMDSEMLQDPDMTKENRLVTVQKLLDKYKNVSVIAHIDTNPDLTPCSAFYFEAKDDSGNVVGAQGFYIDDSIKELILQQAAPLIQNYFKEHPVQYPTVNGALLDRNTEIHLESKTDTYEYGRFIGTTENTVAYFQPGRECTDILDIGIAESILKDPDIQHQVYSIGREKINSKKDMSKSTELESDKFDKKSVKIYEEYDK